MTVDVWSHVIKLAAAIESKIAAASTPVPCDTSEYNWHNTLYTSPQFRRAHIEIVDHRNEHKLYILHCTIFPHVNDPSPIWGFDAVCGPNKITGTFLDFSESGDVFHPMMDWFRDQSVQCSWKKPRPLPYWAQEIFSHSMIAAGNINSQDELDAVSVIALDSLDYYLTNVGMSNTLSTVSYVSEQNRYCRFQKQNPHVVRSMVSMGVPEATVLKFVNEILFPEIR